MLVGTHKACIVARAPVTEISNNNHIALHMK